MNSDIIIIGGGHNALVAAFYLARAGRKPLVLERRPLVGGCATSEEFAPGFRSSTLAHTLGPIRPLWIAGPLAVIGALLLVWKIVSDD